MEHIWATNQWPTSGRKVPGCQTPALSRISKNRQAGNFYAIWGGAQISKNRWALRLGRINYLIINYLIINYLIILNSLQLLGHMKISRRNAITGTNPYCRTLTDPRGGIILNKYYNILWRFMLITDTKKGEQGLRLLIFKLPQLLSVCLIKMSIKWRLSVVIMQWRTIYGQSPRWWP